MHQVNQNLDIGEMATKVWFEPWGMPIEFASYGIENLAEGICIQIRTLI